MVGPSEAPSEVLVLTQASKQHPADAQHAHDACAELLVQGHPSDTAARCTRGECAACSRRTTSTPSSFPAGSAKTLQGRRNTTQHKLPPQARPCTLSDAAPAIAAHGLHLHRVQPRLLAAGRAPDRAGHQPRDRRAAHRRLGVHPHGGPRLAGPAPPLRALHASSGRRAAPGQRRVRQPARPSGAGSRLRASRAGAAALPCARRGRARRRRGRCCRRSGARRGRRLRLRHSCIRGLQTAGIIKARRAASAAGLARMAGCWACARRGLALATRASARGRTLRLLRGRELALQLGAARAQRGQRGLSARGAAALVLAARPPAREAGRASATRTGLACARDIPCRKPDTEARQNPNARRLWEQVMSHFWSLDNEVAM